MTARTALRHVAVMLAITIGAGSLAGCTAEEPQPTPSIDLAGELLGAICPANAADLVFNAVWADEASTLDSIVAAATTARDADAAAAASLDSLAAHWPEDYHADLAVLQRMYEAKVGDYTVVASATDIDPFYDLTFQNPTAGNAAYERLAQRIGTSVDECAAR
jgi:hypothetical protein